MDARFYNSEDIDIERLASDLVLAYQSQSYKAQQIGSKDQILVQIKKGGDLEAVLGMQAVLSITLQRTTGGVLALIGQQRWVDKAAVGAVGIAVLPLLWPLAVTAGVGAVRQASLGSQALNMVDGLVRQQRPGIVVGPVPSQVMPQVQQQWAALPPPEPQYYVPSSQVVNSQPVPQAALPYSSSSQMRCVQCNTPHEPNDTFCSGCGRPLAQRKVYCPNCNSELKPGLAFCSKCGTSTFQTLSAAQQTVPGSEPAPPAPPTPVYTPPAPPTPQPQVYYVPPQPANDVPTVSSSSVPQEPSTPYYVPSVPQEPPVYYIPSQPTNDVPTVSSSSTSRQPETPIYTPPSAPAEPPQTVYYIPPQSANGAPAVPSSSASEQQTTPYYVPPVPQEPPVKPQPRVTIIQSTPKEEPPPPKQRPQTPYYIPSNQAQEPTVQAQPSDTTQTTPASPSPAAQSQVQPRPSKPLVARPISRPLTDPNAPWGLLTFSDGQQIQLAGERAVVGRYDHDVGGVPPEVDLSQIEGADTVSRIHAALEHIGSIYTLTDLNSTNSTRITGKRLEPDKATPINDGDTLQFGKVISTFKKVL